jgi:hypothetical protein
VDNEDIKVRVKRLINDNGGVTSFAKIIGTHQSSLSKCLSPNNNIGIATIDKIVIALGISKSWLLTGDGEMLISSIIKEPINIDYKEKYLQVLEELNEARKETNELRKELDAIKTERLIAIGNVKDAQAG